MSSVDPLLDKLTDAIICFYSLVFSVGGLKKIPAIASILMYICYMYVPFAKLWYDRLLRICNYCSKTFDAL